MASRLLSRAEIGLRGWVCFPTNARPEGLTVHYPGPCPWTTSRSVGGRGIDRSSPARFRDTTDHRFCTAIWRGYQAYHMDAKGGCDIFYDGGVCPHGVRLAARPKNMKSGAQGTADGNFRSKGIQYIGGITSSGVLSPLTDEAKSAFHDWAAYLGWPLRWGHKDWRDSQGRVRTACPGGNVYAWRLAGFPKVAAGPIPKPSEPPKEETVILHFKTKDGHPRTLVDGVIIGWPNGADRDRILADAEKKGAVVVRQTVSKATFDALSASGLSGMDADQTNLRLAAIQQIEEREEQRDTAPPS